MKRVGIVASFAVVVLLLAGCGPRVAPEGIAAASTTAPLTDEASGAPITPPATPEAQGDDPAGTAPTATAAPTAPKPTQSPNFGPNHNNGVIKIELSATCVRPGDLLLITLRTPPKAGLGMIIGYSDYQPHGAMMTGESDANGLYVWRVVVEPTVPEGEAKVLVTSTGANWNREGGGTADVVFRVARGGC